MTSTNKQYKYILVIIDAFTKFRWIFPTKITTTKETINKLDIIQSTFGIQKRTIIDRGTAFSSKESAVYCKTENIDHHMITTGMPRSNGQVERVNRCIIPISTKWYKHTHISKLQRALNSTYHRSISTNPFKLMISVDMRQKEKIRTNFKLFKMKIESNLIKDKNQIKNINYVN